MGAMSRMISPRWILVDADAVDKADIISQLISALKGSEDVVDADLLFQDVMEREELASTAVGAGCAVPHAHSGGISSTRVAAARLKEGLDLSAEDGEPVRLVFLMAGPKSETGLHLKVLSKIARLLHDDDVRNALLKVSDSEGFYQLICGEGR